MLRCLLGGLGGRFLNEVKFTAVRKVSCAQPRRYLMLVHFAKASGDPIKQIAMYLSLGV